MRFLLFIPLLIPLLVFNLGDFGWTDPPEWKLYAAARDSSQVLSVSVADETGRVVIYKTMAVFENKEKYRLVGGEVEKADFLKINNVNIHIRHIPRDTNASSRSINRDDK